MNLIEQIKKNYKFVDKLKIACGGNNRFLYLGATDDVISGAIIINLPNKQLMTMCKWDAYGMPVDLQRYPSKYYTRLVIRE